MSKAIASQWQLEYVSCEHYDGIDSFASSFPFVKTIWSLQPWRYLTIRLGLLGEW